MRLVETFRSMKDIAIGLEDGDEEAIKLVNKLSKKTKTKYQVIFDTEHRIYYGFESYGLSDKKTSSASFYKYSQYCRSNRFICMASTVFQDKLKNVSRDELSNIKASKGTRFKMI